MKNRFARLRHSDAGLAVAEYAVAAIAACAFAAVLFKILTSSGVQALLLEVLKKALKTLL